MVGAQRVRRFGKRFIVVDHVLVVAGFYLVFPLIGLRFASHLGWAAAAVGLALGMRQLAQQGLALFGGALADRFGVRPMIVVGMLLRAAGFALLAYADHPAQLYASCILSGLGGSLFEPARGAVVAKLTRSRERSGFYSLLVTLESVAAVLGALLGSVLLALDFYWVAMGGCAIFVGAALANALVLPAYRVSVHGVGTWAAMRAPLSDRPYLQLVLTLSGYYVLYVQLMLLLPQQVALITGTSHGIAWAYVMEATLALLLLYPMSRFGGRWLTAKGRLQLGLAMMSVSLPLVPMAGGVVSLFFVLALFYVGMLVAEPAREALVAQHAKSRARASYIGLSRIGLAIGGLTGYVAGGYLLDYARVLNMPAMPWQVLALIGLATLMGLARLGRMAQGSDFNCANAELP